MMKWKVTRNSRSSSADRPLGRFVEIGLNDISLRQAIPDQSRSSSQRMHDNITPPHRKQQQGKSHRLSRKDSFAASDCIPINLKDILGITRQRTESTFSNSILLDRQRSRSEVRFSSTDRLTVAYHASPQHHAEFRQQRPASVPKNRCPSPPGKSSGWLRGRKRERMKPTLGVCHGVVKNEASYEIKSNNNQNHRPIHDLRTKEVLIKNHVLNGKSVMEGVSGRRNTEQIMKDKNEMNLTFPCLDINFPNKSKGVAFYPDSHQPNTKTCVETARFKRQKGYAPQPERRKSLQQKEEKCSVLKMTLPPCPSPNRKSTESFKINLMDVSMIATTGCDSSDKALSAELITKTKNDKILGKIAVNEEETNEDHDTTASALMLGKSDSEKYDENNGIDDLKIDSVEHHQFDSKIDGAFTNSENGEGSNSMDTEHSEMSNEEENASEMGSYVKEKEKSPVAEYFHCDTNENSSKDFFLHQNFEKERNLSSCNNDTKIKQEDENEARSKKVDETKGTKTQKVEEIRETKNKELDGIRENKSEDLNEIKETKSKRTDETKQKRNKRSNEIKERKTKIVEEIKETSFAELCVNDCKHPILNSNPRHVSKDKNNNTRELPQKHKRIRSKSSKDSALLRNKNKISIRVTDKENIVDISEQVAPNSHCTKMSSKLVRDSREPKSVSLGNEGQPIGEELSGDTMNVEIPALESSTCLSGQEPFEDKNCIKELLASQECTYKLRPRSTPPTPPPRNKMTAHQEMTVSVVIRNPPSVDENDAALVNSEIPDCSPETLVMKKSFVLTIAKQEMGFRSMCAGKEISYKIESCRNKEHQISVSFLCSGGTKKPLLERQASMSPIADMRLRSISMPPFNRGQNGDLVPVPPPRGGSREGRSRDRQSSKKRRKKDSEFHMPKAVIDELSQVLEKRKRSPDDDSN